jgi:hypothetical protein
MAFSLRLLASAGQCSSAAARPWYGMRSTRLQQPGTENTFSEPFSCKKNDHFAKTGSIQKT